MTREHSNEDQTGAGRPAWSGYALGLIAYALLWYILAGNSGWLFAIPILLTAAATAGKLQAPSRNLAVRQLPGFFCFFFGAMFAGAWDVARRAWHPRRPVSPAWVTCQLHSHSTQVHGLCSAMIGLLPGTLATHLDGQCLHMHVLDERQNWATTLERLERHLDKLLPARST